MDLTIMKVLLLWGIYFFYMILGALLFMGLEYENEKDLFNEFKQDFQELNLTRNLSQTLMNDLSSVYRKAYTMGFDPHSEEFHNKWDFTGSFYFVGTVITTIGFGLTAPITISGQICFLFYSLLGIPLNILLFNTLLDQTVHLLTYMLGRLNHCWRTHRKTTAGSSPKGDGDAFWEPSTAILALSCLLTVTLVILATTPLFVYLENWTVFESLYFAVVAFTTVGFGDFVPSGAHIGNGENFSPHYKVGNLLIIIFGTIVMYTTTALLASVYKQWLDYIIEKVEKYREGRQKTGRNRATVSPQTPSTPVARERAPSISPLRDERNRIMVRKVIQNWRAVKKVSIGQVNTVEASIMKSRMTNNEDLETSTACSVLDAFSSTRLSSDNNECMSSKIKEQTSLEELSNIEEKLTKEYDKLMRDIQQRKDTLTERNESLEKGIENGIVLSISPISSTFITTISPEGETNPCACISEEDDHEIGSIMSNHSLQQ